MNELKTIETVETQDLASLPAGQRALFDYGALDAETRIVVQQRAGEIKSIAKRVAHDVVEIGHKLADVKQRLANGKFNEWLSAELGWSERTAYNFIAVYSRFGAANFALENVAVSALYLLAAPSTPAEAVEVARQIADGGEKVTHEVAKEVVRQAKARKPKQVELIEEPGVGAETEEALAEPFEDQAVREAKRFSEIMAEVQTCRVCGCTEADCRQCVEKTGAPCHWVTKDLCSACVAEPVKVLVSQADLDEMDRVNAVQKIDQGERVSLYHMDGGEFCVITDTGSSGARGVFEATGWLVKPEVEAGGVVLRDHPADLDDDLEDHAETYLGVRVNVGAKARPECWVVVGPAYEFKLAPAEEGDEQPETEHDGLPSGWRWEMRGHGATGFRAGTEDGALRTTIFPTEVEASRAAHEVAAAKAEGVLGLTGRGLVSSPAVSEPAPASKAASGAKPAQQRPVVEATPNRPAVWYKTRVEITITLMPGGDGATRKVMHSVRAGEGMPFVELTTGEEDLVNSLPIATFRLFEKAAEAFAKEQAKKPAPKASAKPTTKSKPAAKKPAAKSTKKGGKK